MNDIVEIYHNDIGICFQWKADLEKNIKDRFQLIIKDTGFYLTHGEIENFKSQVDHTWQKNKCGECPMVNNCRSMLLRTPCPRVDMAINKVELHQVEDLIAGTLFQIGLDDYLKNMSLN